MKRSFWTIGCLVMMCSAMAVDPETGSTVAGQSIADALREATGAQAAFFPAAGLKKSNSLDLRDHLVFPTDEVAVVKLSGAQIKLALERSVSFFPTPNSGFLQLSGIEATFKKSASPDERIVVASVGSSRISDSAQYEVAMPATLARGGLGYFKVWNREAIARKLDDESLESVVAGQKVSESAPRWTAVP